MNLKKNGSRENFFLQALAVRYVSSHVQRPTDHPECAVIEVPARKTICYPIRTGNFTVPINLILY